MIVIDGNWNELDNNTVCEIAGVHVNRPTTIDYEGIRE